MSTVLIAPLQQLPHMVIVVQVLLMLKQQIVPIQEDNLIPHTNSPLYNIWLLFRSIHNR